ncbi:MAG: methionine gamma-lyase family protein [Clostridia bacterium]|nr:methionine gamma-lyase family protein [Clostridia bacterium]
MFSQKIQDIARAAEGSLRDEFARIDEIAHHNTAKVMEAFSEFRVSKECLLGTDGYGYDDRGRETLDKVVAKVFNAEDAFIRHNIINGTHALTIALFGILRPGDVMLAVTGKPYDTLDEVIGLKGADGTGSLADFGIEYRQVELGEDFSEQLKDPRVKMVYIQRSKGYVNRPTLSVEEINKIVEFSHARSNAYVVVDNCYGEFVDTTEPKADLIIGSLIKNPGGGMAESGGYIAGKKESVELCSYRYSCPAIGLEAGATLDQNKNLYRGFFYAPHTVAQALKTAQFAAACFETAGFEVSPKPGEKRNDIIQTVTLGDPDKLIKFCQGIQAGSPIDSYVAPMPWAMPGYSDEVIMAAGAFVQGSSIELSADGPMREPYLAFLQGGLTYESGRYGIMKALEFILE